MFEKLLEQVKQKCNITWHDEDTEKRITKIVNSAIPTLKHKLGISQNDFDFSEDGMENTLFLNYCFYEWNHALNEFDDNYSNDIAQIRAKYEVQYYLNHEDDDEE